MGIILIIVGILIALIISMKLFRNNELYSDIVTPIIIVILIVSLLCIFAGLLINYSTIDATIASNTEVYNSLLYQVENQMYNNDNEFGKKELVNQITEWNSDLAANKCRHNNFWVNIFYPIDYDQFEFIPIGMIK